MAAPSRGTGYAAIPSSRSVGPVGAYSSLGVGRERENPEPLASPRQMRTVAQNAPMHKHTVGHLARWAITGAANSQG